MTAAAFHGPVVCVVHLQTSKNLLSNAITGHQCDSICQFIFRMRGTQGQVKFFIIPLFTPSLLRLTGVITVSWEFVYILDEGHCQCGRYQLVCSWLHEVCSIDQTCHWTYLSCQCTYVWLMLILVCSYICLCVQRIYPVDADSCLHSYLITLQTCLCAQIIWKPVQRFIALISDSQLCLLPVLRFVALCKLSLAIPEKC